MESKFQDYRQAIEAIIETHAIEPNKIRQANSISQGIQSIIGNINTYLKDRPFESIHDEIRYYKTEAPFYYSRLFLYLKICKLELFKQTSGKDKQAAYLANEIDEIDKFFSLHSDFVHYMLLESTYLDEKLFSRSAHVDCTLDDIASIICENLTVASYKTAWIKANEVYKERLVFELELLKNPELIKNRPYIRFEWNCTIADATEIITGLSIKNAVKANGKIADIKQLTEMWTQLFQMQIPNIYDKKRINQKRKKEKTPFLSSIVKAMNESEPRQAKK
jgi:hypothetical protein